MDIKKILQDLNIIAVYYDPVSNSYLFIYNDYFYLDGIKYYNYAEVNKETLGISHGYLIFDPYNSKENYHLGLEVIDLSEIKLPLLKYYCYVKNLEEV